MDRMRVALLLLCPNRETNARSFEWHVKALTRNPRHFRHGSHVGALSDDYRFCFNGTDLSSKELLDLVIKHCSTSRRCLSTVGSQGWHS